VAKDLGSGVNLSAFELCSSTGRMTDFGELCKLSKSAL